MSPRAYSMERRTLAAKETRRRIVYATMAAHAELGIAETSFQDVAERADVAVGTVYRHFPRLEDLVVACGAAARQLIDLPTDGQVAEIFARVRGREDRVERLVSEVGRLYAVGAIGFVRLREAHRTLPFLTRDHELWEGAIDALVAEALRPLRTTRWPQAHVRSLLDARFWVILSERGLGRPEAEALLRRLVSCALGSPREAQPGGRQPPVASR